MTHRIVFHTEAVEEILEAARYIRREAGAEIARVWHHELVTKIRSLEEHPHRCAYAREHFALEHTATLRQLLYKSHRVIYMVQGGEVHILHVRHGRQDTLEEL